MAAQENDTSPRSSIKDPDTYDALRDKGASKEKAARIANAKANPDQTPSRDGGKATRYEERTREQLYQRAKEIGIDGRSNMDKSQLIDALRNH